MRANEDEIRKITNLIDNDLAALLLVRVCHCLVGFRIRFRHDVPKVGMVSRCQPAAGRTQTARTLRAGCVAKQVRRQREAKRPLPNAFRTGQQKGVRQPCRGSQKLIP